MSTVKDAVRTTLAENFGGVAQDKAPKGSEAFSLDAVPDLSGKVLVITGGSEGIGYGTVHTWLKHGAARVIALSPSTDKHDDARAAIANELGPEAAKRIEWHALDLADWQATVDVAKRVAQSTDRIDALALNAGRGIMTAQVTDMGVDRHMAINHFGHVLLTSHLLPILKQSTDHGYVRIATQASNAHQGAPKGTKFASLDEINHDDGANAQYGRSKLANILYARYLARNLSAQNPKILCNATHPGFVDTKMSSDDILEPFPIAGYAMRTGMAPFKKDQYEGAVSLLFATTAIEKTGQYICPPAIEEPGNDFAQNEKLGDQLMKLTLDVFRQKFPAAADIDLY